MKYAVIYERAEHNKAAYVPDLPSCVATGRTRQEVEERIREATRLHLEACATSVATFLREIDAFRAGRGDEVAVERGEPRIKLQRELQVQRVVDRHAMLVG